MNYYGVEYNLREHPEETYLISKYVAKQEEEINPKIIRAMVELLVNGYLDNASEKNINECFELLIINQNAEIDWKNSEEINDLLEKYF